MIANSAAQWAAPAFMEQCRWEFGAQTASGRTDGRLMDGSVPWWLFLRRGQYKYIRTLVDNEIEELYDLHRDPNELHNLAQLPEHRDRVEQFDRELIAELKRTDAAMADHLPAPRRVAR